MTGEYIREQLIKREIRCSVCGLQRWDIGVHRDSKGMIGFDGECRNCNAVIRGSLPMWQNTIRIAHNGERPQTFIRYSERNNHERQTKNGANI